MLSKTEAPVTRRELLCDVRIDTLGSSISRNILVFLPSTVPDAPLIIGTVKLISCHERKTWLLDATNDPWSPFIGTLNLFDSAYA